LQLRLRRLAGKPLVDKVDRCIDESLIKTHFFPLPALPHGHSGVELAPTHRSDVLEGLGTEQLARQLGVILEPRRIELATTTAAAGPRAWAGG